MKDRLNVLSVRPTRRQFLQAASLLSLGCLSGCLDNPKTLNFYNWSLYIGPNTVKEFEQASGIRVNYDECSSADVMFAKLKIGTEGYDLIVTPDYMLRRLIRQNLVQPLPKKVPGERLYERLRHPPWDPNQEWSIPYLWGTVGIAYLKDRVLPAPDSWKVLFDGKYGRSITMLDEKRDTLGAALISQGFSGNSVNPQELEQAKQALLRQKQWVRRYTSDFIDDLIRHETSLALAWSGDVHQAASDPTVGYAIPKEGSFLFVDNMAIPRAAPHPDAAMQFILYYMQPEVAAGVTNGCGYANPIEASERLVRPEILADPLTYPSKETMRRLVFQEDLGAGEKLWDRIWEEVKR
ncbi:MAG: spermidine/putrescine ABC transporter substrate-binding protein [Candidatus Eremiobacteraeota bacterium]|nr:spermidine/putrescine ABC transporter substrate-binding protein [Candidatus Eremiobacteraeota bacterium]